MSDALVEAGASDALIEEVACELCRNYGGPHDPTSTMLGAHRAALGYAASVIVRRLRKAGVSDLVIGKALIDEAASR